VGGSGSGGAGGAVGAGARRRAAKAVLLICDVTKELVSLLPGGMATRLLTATNDAAARAVASGVAVVYTRLELGGLARQPTPGRHPLLQVSESRWSTTSSSLVCAWVQLLRDAATIRAHAWLASSISTHVMQL
jgi:hypothetical protein